MCNWSGWCGWCGWCRCHIEYPAHKMQQKKQQSGYILWRLAYNMNIMLVLFTQLLLFLLSQLLSFLLWEVCDLCHFTSHSLRVVLDLACRHTSLYARGLGLLLEGVPSLLFIERLLASLSFSFYRAPLGFTLSHTPPLSKVLAQMLNQRTCPSSECVSLC